MLSSKENSSTSNKDLGEIMIGLFIGRFQPFHLGHLEAVKYILGKVDRIIIVVGSSQFCYTYENPFTAGERISMIEEALRDEGIPCEKYMIIPVPDIQSHKTWTAHVLTLVPEFHIIFSNNPSVLLPFRDLGFKVEEVPLINRSEYCATEVRRRIAKNENWEELVPPAVARFIRRIGGEKRIRSIIAGKQ